MKYAIGLTVVLFAVWLVWSTHWDEPLLVGFGVASCIAVVALLSWMRLLDEEAVPLMLALPALAYLPWLVKEIALSNVDVARRILSPTLSISPRVVKVEASQRTDLGRVIFANSITLTPGTLSLDVEAGCIEVHALSAEAADGLVAGEMNRRVCRLEGRRG